MQYIIDRLEEGLAVCEDELKQMHSIPTGQLPPGITEGDVLVEDGNHTFSIDSIATQKRRAQMRQKLLDLFG